MKERSLADRKHQHLYNKAAWRGPNGVRLAKLRRDPICEVTGCSRPATAVDHRKKHNGDWFLFMGGIDMANLRALCSPHHDAKEERYETGREEFNPVSVTGEQGRQFQASRFTSEQLDAAIGTKADLAELLSGIPE
jgi:5-methylcytosine-specific restriction endonuclease McrA